jgi:hypothetical protein
MSDIRPTLSFDRLAQEFPFLAWPRVTVVNAKYKFLVQPGYTIDEYDFNFSQIFATNVELGEDPLVDTLRRHLRAIENRLRFGVRSVTGQRVDNFNSHLTVTCTGGLLWWAEQGITITHPRLAVFRGRGFTYRSPQRDPSIDYHELPMRPGSWLSDVGLLP